jgi:response regulator RpfG family c-di-GMP phosphodiesterase
VACAPGVALDFILSERGRQFDPRVVDALPSLTTSTAA